MPDNIQSLPEFDACVIGAGAGGCATAWALCKKGLRVLVLETGPEYKPQKDFHLEKSDWELQPFPDRTRSKHSVTYAEFQTLENQFDHLRSWNHINGYSNQSGQRQPFAYHHVQAVGGSTLHFTAEAHRMNPKSMNMFSDFGVAADWPVSYKELEPYYVQVEKIVGVSGPNKSHHCSRSQALPLPAHKISYASSKLLNKKSDSQRDMKWEENTLAIPSKPYDGRPACNYCNNCNRGCTHGDKATADRTFLKKALETGLCVVKSGCHVLELTAGKNDQVENILYIDNDKKRISIALHKRPVFINAGAIFTPRLLLISKNKYAPKGLGNESGQVGKSFMETLFYNVAGLHKDPIGSHRGIPSDVISWKYNAPDAIPGVIGGCRFSPTTAESELNGPLSYAKRVVAGFGSEHKQAMKHQFGRVLAVGGIGESLPNDKTFIDLHPDRTDKYGIPLVRINSHLDTMAIKRIQFMRQQCEKILLGSGVEKIIEQYGTYDYFNSTHVFGTCKMGADAETSVVNSQCRSHRWKNLFITDSSVFPSSGGGESPSLTIQALAIRAVELMDLEG